MIASKVPIIRERLALRLRDGSWRSWCPARGEQFTRLRLVDQVVQKAIGIKLDLNTLSDDVLRIKVSSPQQLNLTTPAPFRLVLD